MQTYIDATGRYPITADQIKSENPNTSFPQYLQPSDVEPLGYFPVADIAPEFNPLTQYLVEGVPIETSNGWIKTFTVVDYTNEEVAAQEAARLAAEEAARKASIPVQVTMRQARLALNQANLLYTVDAAIANGTDEAAKIEWEYAQDVRRDWPLVIALMPALGLTETQLDDLFVLAAGL